MCYLGVTPLSPCKTFTKVQCDSSRSLQLDGCVTRWVDRKRHASRKLTLWFTNKQRTVSGLLHSAVFLGESWGWPRALPVLQAIGGIIHTGTLNRNVHWLLVGFPKFRGCQNWKAFWRPFSILQMGKLRLTKEYHQITQNFSRKSKNSNLVLLGQELISVSLLFPSSADFLRFGSIVNLN